MAFAMYVTSQNGLMAASLLCLKPIDVPWSVNNGDGRVDMVDSKVKRFPRSPKDSDT